MQDLKFHVLFILCATILPTTFIILPSENKERKEQKNMTLFANTITLGDMVFASLSVDGKTTASLRNNRFHSISEVISSIYRIAGSFAGMASLLIRNQSQGWSTTIPLVSSKKPTHKTNFTHIKPMAKNGQYLIPW